MTAVGTGCSWLGISRGTGETRLISEEQPSEMVTRPTLGSYRALDSNTADIYLTDLPAEAFQEGADWRKYTGSLVHLHIFIRPTPGATPIATTASNTTVRQLVLVNGAMGLYGGGGFLYPSGTLGEGAIGGSMEEATLRPLAATPGFADRLGPATFTCRFDVERDARAALAMGEFMARGLEIVNAPVAATAE